MRRRATGIGCVLVLGALAWPAASGKEIDSLPLSNYPMFAHPRPRVSSFDVAVIVDESGEQRRLGAMEVGGTDQVMQAAMTLRYSIRSHTADKLCREIASRVDVDGTIEVATMRFDAVAWFQGDREPTDVRVHAECRSRARP